MTRFMSIRTNELSDKSFFILSIAIITSLTILVYSNSLTNEFTNWDDESLVVNNGSIRSLGFDNLQKIFTPRAGSTYQPLRLLSYALDYHIWKLNPLGYHLVNTLLHGLSAIFLYLVLTHTLSQIRSKARRSHEERRRGETFSRANRLISLYAVLLFVVHPVNVESVVWISSRKYGLLALFSFSAFYFFIKISEGERYHTVYAISSLMATLLALMSSPFAVSLPGLFFLYDYCRDSSNNVFVVFKRRFSYYLPCIILCIPIFMVVWNALVSSEKGGAAVPHYEGNPINTLLTMFRVLFDYIRNLIFPLWLNNRYVDYISVSVFHYQIITSVITIGLLVSFLFRQVKSKHKLPLFCLGWFLITWLPVSNIIPIAGMMADRYMYIPAVGLFLGFSLTIRHLSDNLILSRRFDYMPVLKVALLIFLSCFTFQRNEVWRNSITLWKDSVKKDPYNPIAHNNLGLAFYKIGKYDEAVRHYSEALNIKPDFSGAHNNLGNALTNQGKTTEAIAHYKQALKINPAYIKAHINLGNVLKEEGNYNEAIYHYSEVLKAVPDFADIHSYMGNVRYRQRQTAEAISHYSMAIEFNPEYAEAHNNLANVLLEQKDYKKAIRHYKAALEVDPTNPLYLNNMGSALSESGRFSEAVRYFSEALKIDPDSAEVHKNLGMALYHQKNYDKAASHFSEALRLQPDYQTARENLNAARKMSSRIGASAKRTVLPQVNRDTITVD
jgi:protein O-mannosyl-transferase